MNLLLLAGYPGTGKSYLCDKILAQDNSFKILSPDLLKEHFWDKFGFENEDQKNDLIDKAWAEYYNQMDSMMRDNDNIISDYPFSDKQKQTISEIAEKNNCNIITIRLVGDIGILFDRQQKRDIDNDRHLGHVAMPYYKNMEITDRKNLSGILTKDVFFDRCQNRGYGDFELGYTIEVDVSYYDKIDYNKILQMIKSNMK